MWCTNRHTVQLRAVLLLTYHYVVGTTLRDVITPRAPCRRQLELNRPLSRKWCTSMRRRSAKKVPRPTQGGGGSRAAPNDAVVVVGLGWLFDLRVSQRRTPDTSTGGLRSATYETDECRTQTARCLSLNNLTQNVARFFSGSVTLL